MAFVVLHISTSKLSLIDAFYQVLSHCVKQFSWIHTCYKCELWLMCRLGFQFCYQYQNVTSNVAELFCSFFVGSCCNQALSKVGNAELPLLSAATVVWVGIELRCCLQSEWWKCICSSRFIIKDKFSFPAIVQYSKHNNISVCCICSVIMCCFGVEPSINMLVSL